MVKAGCMNTLKLQSRFCALHDENIAIPQQLDPDSDEHHRKEIYLILRRV